MLIESKLFEEFIMRRCEEISQNDEKYQEINQLILELDTELKDSAPENIVNKLVKYERLNIDLIAHAQVLFYSQAIQDSKIGV